MKAEEIRNIRVNYILATGRTGSTMLCSMFNAHPDIISPSEEPFTYNLYPKYSKIKKWDGKLIKEYCDDFFLFTEGKLEAQFGSRHMLEQKLLEHRQTLDFDLALRLTYLCFFPFQKKERVLAVFDKQLRFHFVIRKLSRMYPQSRFIILLRDPRDNAVAKWRAFRQNVKGLNFFNISCNWNFTYRKLLAAKKRIGPEKFLEVKYEDLVSKPEEELRRICIFFGIPFNKAMLSFNEHVELEFENTAKHISASTFETINRYHSSLKEKINIKKVGYWRQNLTAAQAGLVWKITGKLAEHLGYEAGGDVPSATVGFKECMNYLKIVIVRFISICYYFSPFMLKKMVKKIKYGKRYKTSLYTNNNYYSPEKKAETGL